MLHLFRTSLRSLCSTVWNARAIQRCVQRSSVWAKRQSHPLVILQQSLIGCDAAHDPDANSAPIRLTRHDNWRLPRFFSNANAWFAQGSEPVLHHRDLEYQRHERELPRSSRRYRPKCAVFCRLFSYPHRSPGAPFFGRLDTLTVQDGRTRLAMMPFGSTRLFTQGIVDTRPGAIQTPIAKVGVNRLPWREIMRQSISLTTCPQNIQDSVDDLASQMISAATTAFHRWN